MAVSSIPVPPDPARDARARALVDRVGAWPRHTLKLPSGAFPAGTVFRRAPGSKGACYLVNAVCCECPDYQQSHNICKHIRAVLLWEQRIAAEDAELAAVLGPQSTSRYDRLFPGCKECGDPADGKDGYCDRCASDREWAARRDR